MKKLILLSLTLLLTMFFVISGFTLAFFSDQETVGSTVFEMGSLSLTSVNTYSAADDPYAYVKYPSWTVQNTGSMNLMLKVKVQCAWAPRVLTEVEREVSTDASTEASSETDVEIMSESSSEVSSEPSSEIESVTETETESISELERVVEVKQQPSYIVTLSEDLWYQDENGWYVYRNPVFPNEMIQVDAEITVIDPDWQGALELFFEAEASEATFGGDL